MKSIEPISKKEKDVLSSLGVYLYLDNASLDKITGQVLRFREAAALRWKAGSNIYQSAEARTGKKTWVQNEFAGVVIINYVKAGGLLYDNEECLGEGIRWILK